MTNIAEPMANTMAAEFAQLERGREAIYRERLPRAVKLAILIDLEVSFIRDHNRCPGCGACLKNNTLYDRGPDGYECEGCR